MKTNVLVAWLIGIPIGSLLFSIHIGIRFGEFGFQDILQPYPFFIIASYAGSIPLLLITFLAVTFWPKVVTAIPSKSAFFYAFGLSLVLAVMLGLIGQSWGFGLFILVGALGYSLPSAWIFTRLHRDKIILDVGKPAP